MKPLDEATTAMFSAQGAALAHAMLVIRGDNTILALTDHDRDLSFGGVRYSSAPGMAFGGLHTSADLAPDHALITTAASPAGITAEEVASGRLAHSYAELWRVAVEETSRRRLLSVGTIGEVTLLGDEVRIEYRGRQHGLSAPVGKVYRKPSLEHVAENYCLEHPEHVDVEGTLTDIDGVSVSATLVDTVPAAALEGGTLEVLDGPYAGMVGTVRVAHPTVSGYRLILWAALGAMPIAGTAVRISVRCPESSGETAFPTIPGFSVLSVAYNGRR